MTRTSDLNTLLNAQRIAQESREMCELRDHRENVEATIRWRFPEPTPRSDMVAPKPKGQ